MAYPSRMSIPTVPVGFADARILGRVASVHVGDVRTRLEVRVPTREGREALISVSLSGNPVAAPVPVVGTLVLVWGELRDGGEVAVDAGFGEIRAMSEALAPTHLIPTAAILPGDAPTPTFGTKRVATSSPATTPAALPTSAKVMPLDDDFATAPVIAITELLDAGVTYEEIPPPPPESIVVPVRAPRVEENPGGAPLMRRAPSFGPRKPATVATAPVSVSAPTVAALPAPTPVVITPTPVVTAPATPPPSAGILETKAPEAARQPGREGGFIAKRRAFRTTPDETDRRAMALPEES